MKINEDLNKTDINNGIKTYMSSAEFKEKVNKIVKDRLSNNKEIEDKSVEITKNVLIQLFKTLWLRRNTWITGLSNRKS